MKRFYYRAAIEDFIEESSDAEECGIVELI